MAGTKILADTGPLVGYLSRSDQHHRWAVEAFDSIHDPLHTCEAVISEVIFLLQSDGAPVEPFLQLLERGLVRVDFNLAQHEPDVMRLLRKYHDRPMALADACLVRMAELADPCQVFTTDRDFLVYRRRGRHVIPLLSPFAG